MNVYLPVKLFIILLLFFLSLFVNAQNKIPKDSISNNLEEVVITQNKKSFSNQNGNIKLDVANSIYNAIPNTLDLLAKMPTVQMGADRESISVVGKGSPLIYIDNQKVSINDLNALAVADIKTIEIIKNPSAKYEDVGLVVILITRKFIQTEQFTINYINSKARYVVDNHEISIAVKYSFGKVKETELKMKNIDENVNRIR